MTSTADPAGLGAVAAPGRGRALLNALILIAVLMLGAISTPDPWAMLWLAVPLSVACALLVSWRYGAWGSAVPVALAVVAIASGPTLGWAWWIPPAALTGVWMGLREEGGGPTLGQRAWMLLPVLALAASLPWVHYADFVARVDEYFRGVDRQMLELSHQSGEAAARLRTLERAVADTATVRTRVLPHLLPTLLFVWVTALVALGRALASRTAGMLRWPTLSRPRLADWRLPDGALWLVIAGLLLLAVMGPAWAPTAWTLLLNAGLGYCVQGIAVVESLLLARGVPPSVIVLTFLFVFTLAAPLFMLGAAFVGVSDVWLDYRRLEPSPDGE